MVLNLRFMTFPSEFLSAPTGLSERSHIEDDGRKRYCPEHGAQGGVMHVTGRKMRVGALQVPSLGWTAGGVVPTWTGEGARHSTKSLTDPSRPGAKSDLHPL